MFNEAEAFILHKHKCRVSVHVCVPLIFCSIHSNEWTNYNKMVMKVYGYYILIVIMNILNQLA